MIYFVIWIVSVLVCFTVLMYIYEPENIIIEDKQTDWNLRVIAD